MTVDHAARRPLRITSEQMDHIAQRERAEIERRVALYRGGRTRLGIAGRDVVIVDDGMATGSTAAAAVSVARHLGAARVTVAVPVGSLRPSTG